MASKYKTTEELKKQYATEAQFQTVAELKRDLRNKALQSLWHEACETELRNRGLLPQTANKSNHV